MKKLNALNLGESLKREEMRSISGGAVDLELDGYCTCGTKSKVLTSCDCTHFCNGTCNDRP